MSKRKQFTKTRSETEIGVIIKYAVPGFWSVPINVCQDVGFGNWKWGEATISRSSGGYEESTDHIKAEENFAAALLDAIAEAKQLNKRKGKKAKPTEQPS